MTVDHSHNEELQPGLSNNPRDSKIWLWLDHVWVDQWTYGGFQTKQDDHECLLGSPGDDQLLHSSLPSKQPGAMENPSLAIENHPQIIGKSSGIIGGAAAAKR